MRYIFTIKQACIIELPPVKFVALALFLALLHSIHIFKESVYKHYTTYNNNSAIIKANKAVASEKAKPNIEYENNWFFNEGFLATPTIKHPNTIPIPTPAPARPIVAKPAPISFEDSNIY